MRRLPKCHSARPFQKRLFAAILFYSFTIVPLAMRARAFATPTPVGVPEQVAFLQQPTDTLEGRPLSPIIKVVVEDANGLVVPTATNLIRVNLTGVYGLRGKRRVAARRGVAQFNDLTVGFPGTFTLTASSPGLRASTSATFTVTITAGFPPVPATYFGLSVGQVGIVPSNILFSTTRSWDDSPDLSWGAENPSPGKYDFTTLDYFLDDYGAKKVDMIYTFGRTPRWASSQPDVAAAYGPGQCAPPADLRIWDGYVQAIAAHSAGRIKYWELWNEPQDPQYYCGDIPTMVAMAQHAAKILKAVDPSAVVLSPAATGPDGPAWISTFLSTGGASAVDVLAFHGYWSATAEDVLPVVSSYKAVARTYARPGTPVWDTEDNWAGFGNLPTPSSAQQAGFLAKSFLLQWSVGVSRFIWYQYGGGFWGGLQASSSGPNAAAIALQQTYLWMVGASPSAPCSKSASGVWTCAFTRPGGYKAEAMWISGASVTVSVPPEFIEYLDLAGTAHPGTDGSVVVGEQPILLENQALP